jgi:amino acid adenylation domain-containing protein
MISILYIAFYRYTSEDEINLGIVFANRENPFAEDVVACLVNTLPLAINFKTNNEADTYAGFIDRLVKRLNAYMEYSAYPLLDILADSEDKSLFQIVFASQHIIHKSNNYTKLDYSNKSAKFDLAFNFYHTLDPEVLEVEFNASKYSRNYIERFLSSVKNILTQLAINPENRLTTINLLDYQDYQQQIYSWNETSVSYDKDLTIAELFVKQVNKTPDSTALVYQDKELSYRELDEKANQLANFLIKEYQIKGDDLVALCLKRNENMLITILGVIKAGGAYVPIDPEYPDDRIEYVLEDTKAKVVLTNQEYMGRLCKLGGNPIAVDDKEIETCLNQQSVVAPLLEIDSTNLAYVIYTSGTTGKPKGVMIEHRNVMNLCNEFIHAHKLDVYQEIAIYSNYVFDAFVYETIPALVNGNKLFLLDEDKRLSVDNLAKYLRVNQIKVMFIPTILLKEFLITLKDKNPLKLIYTGGEKLPELDPEYIPRGLTILNEYGPTESTVCSTYKEYHPGVQSSNIGKPIKNIMTYILDPNFMPLPQGVVGELYIGGDSLGRGYLNRPELTKEKFIANPFQSKEDQAKNRNNRIYKTGDLVRYFENGEIEYIGRNDFQVKIRGFRIELGEIEVALNHYCSINADNAQIYPIRQSVVLVMGDESSNKASEDKYIVAYYVSNEPLLEEVLFSHLKANLPEYMLPSVLIHLEKLPQTVNGKLDRKKLPKPELRSNKNYVAPRGEFDFRICEIYADILGLELSLLGIDDDFFRLGGNSIKAIKVVNRLSNELDFKITITDFFKYSTIRQLIDNCRDLYSDKELVTIPKSFDLSDDSNDSQLPLSFAQERLWFYEKYSGGSYAYNIPVLYELGTQVNCDKLTKALQEVVKRHKTLHSLIDTDVNGQGYTRVINLDKKPLIIDQYSLESIDELMKLMQKEANHIYDLAKEYPLRASLYRLKDNRLFLSLVVHHIAFDGWSMDIFLHDLYQFYINDQDSTDLPKLTKLAINYIDFASWQKNFLTGDKLQMQLNYWKDKLNDYSGFSLKTDFLRPALVNNSGDNVYFDLDTILSNDLRKIAKKLGVSLYTVLLSGFYLFLRVYSNQNDLVVGSPVANRNYPELENIIGFFVNTLALRSTIDPNEILANYIREVGRVSLLSQSYQDTPFEKIVNELKIAKDQSRHPLFQILFSVQDFGSTNKLDSYSGLFAKGSEFAGIFSGYKVAKFDLTVMLNDAEEVISGVFNYATSLYKQDTIIGFIDTYKLILSQFLTKLHAPIAKLAYLTKDDYSKVIYQWNKTDQEYLSEDLFIHKLFEKQVLKNPDKIALNYAGLSLSYSQLNSRSNRLANYLRKTYDISKNDLIILFLKRSELIPLSILAVLKAGAAYVPVDPDIPEERLSYILADTASKVILTNLSSSDKLNRVIDKDKHNIKVEFLDVFDFIDNRLSELNPEFNLSHDSLAYVIYTSGTTGNPKGVIHSHHGLANGVLNELNLGIIDANSRVLGKTAYVYDPSVRETFMPLLSGGQLCLVDEEIIKDNERLLKCIKENNINLAIFTPSHLNVFISALEDIGDFESLKGLTIFSCGEPINSQLRDKVVKEFGVTLHVQYGVSELSQVFYRYKINADNLEFSLSHNNKAYILDAMLNPLPIGSIGELYMGGDGLSLGYLNLPELIAARFIRNPFQTEVEKVNNKNARLYKTGDLVYYHEDGSIEYIGRNDFQIKIRGFRVELAEIENRLLAYSGIRYAIVVAKEIAGAKDSSSKYLLAYYVADEPLNEESIYKYLTNRLPDYMLPHKIVYLRELPLTINGKLDRKALPSPDFHQTNEFTPPRTELESIVCNTMIDILGMEDRLVSIKDDFFMLGGNSILSIKLASKLNNTLGSKLKVAEIFSAKTVENIAKLIDSYGEGDFQTLVQLNHAPKNPSIVMFHPATGGCEVYSNLANRLTAYYQCYGIDNYNLHHKLKYTDLASLTDYYLQTIKTNGIIKEDKSQAITMFGWCLGGLFALEAAAILESEGYSNINVYLLDTVIHDDKLHEVTDRIDHGFIKKFMKDALSTKYEEGYVNKIIDNFDTENRIGRGRPRQRLEKTRVYLYKAMQKDTRVQLDILDAVFKEVREIKSNNLELVVMNPKEQINLFTLYDAHHGNILEQDIVVEHLISHINNLK